jgi:hypothetical protein
MYRQITRGDGSNSGCSGGSCRAVYLALQHRPSSPDPNDDMVLDVAINGATSTDDAAVAAGVLGNLSIPTTRVGQVTDNETFQARPRGPCRGRALSSMQS